MRSAANGHVKMAKISRTVPITAYRDRVLFIQKLNAACFHRHGAREKLAISFFNTPIFLVPPQDKVN